MKRPYFLAAPFAVLFLGWGALALWPRPDSVALAKELQQSEGCKLVRAIYQYRQEHGEVPKGLSEIGSWPGWWYDSKASEFSVYKYHYLRHSLWYNSANRYGRCEWIVDFEDGVNYFDLEDVCGVCQ